MGCDCSTWILGLIVVIIALIKFFTKSSMWRADGSVMHGKTVIITGANAGIGKEIAAELAYYGATIIMACRDVEKGAAARAEIISRLGNSAEADIDKRLVVESLNLASFASIHSFAQTILKKQSRIDVLINNAGIGYVSRRAETEDGLELTMGTNHFGHFLLTNLLLDRLKASAPSRVIVVSSRGHQFGQINFDDINSKHSYNRFKVYFNSKLANVLFVRELARQLEGSGVVVNAAHPGEVVTEFLRHLPPAVVWLFKNVANLFLKSPKQGAQTIVYLAASQAPEVLASGKYFEECREGRVSSRASDDSLARKLWEVSEHLTGIN